MAGTVHMGRTVHMGGTVHMAEIAHTAGTVHMGRTAQWQGQRSGRSSWPRRLYIRKQRLMAVGAQLFLFL